MKRIHILGRKNHGKTTLVVELVERLVATGLRVGTIKHTHHKHELDVPGKDSHRHRAAGAAVSAIASPGMNAVFWSPAPRGLQEPADYEAFAPYFASCDLVIVEGDTLAAAPKIEVWRQAVGSQPIALEDSSIAALVTDDPWHGPIPIWPRREIERIAQGVLDLIE
ncbi:MAG: molybdopterin-guanine dinucleotide biosynthesis protein B [Pirellulales bacterium]|nr:molybdopterin-guanine dinucleotide biosynthesis protein B [Pirellulales bacterium]